MDAIQTFKAAQRDLWVSFAPQEAVTTRPAAELVRFAGVRPGQRLLDVACGTGVVAVTAARMGCQVTGLDLTPELLERARENARLAGVSIDWREGDVEDLPFPDSHFNAVLSQFGHIFGPRPAVTVAEMLRVLEPGGTIAFSTWPPDQFAGRTFELVSRYSPPAPPVVAPPILWGDPQVVRERLGSAVTSIRFERGCLQVPVLSPRHYLVQAEKLSPRTKKLLDALASEPDRLAAFRNEYEAVAAEYFHDNAVHQKFLMTRAIKT